MEDVIKIKIDPVKKIKREAKSHIGDIPPEKIHKIKKTDKNHNKIEIDDNLLEDVTLEQELSKF